MKVQIMEVVNIFLITLGWSTSSFITYSNDGHDSLHSKHLIQGSQAKLCTADGTTFLWGQYYRYTSKIWSKSLFVYLRTDHHHFTCTEKQIGYVVKPSDWFVSQFSWIYNPFWNFSDQDETWSNFNSIPWKLILKIALRHRWIAYFMGSDQ